MKSVQTDPILKSGNALVPTFYASKDGKLRSPSIEVEAQYFTSLQ